MCTFPNPQRAEWKQPSRIYMAASHQQQWMSDQQHRAEQSSFPYLDVVLVGHSGRRAETAGAQAFKE